MLPGEAESLGLALGYTGALDLDAAIRTLVGSAPSVTHGQQGPSDDAAVARAARKALGNRSGSLTIDGSRIRDGFAFQGAVLTVVPIRADGEDVVRGPHDGALVVVGAPASDALRLGRVFRDRIVDPCGSVLTGPAYQVIEARYLQP